MTDLNTIAKQMELVAEFNDSLFTEEEREFIAKLRARGCAVAIFAPEEMADADADRVETAMVEAGADYIDYDVAIKGSK